MMLEIDVAHLHTLKAHRIVTVVFFRDNFTCQACGLRGSPGEIQAHHKIASSRGGPTTLDNLHLLCRKCHCKADAESRKIGWIRRSERYEAAQRLARELAESVEKHERGTPGRKAKPVPKKRRGK